MTASVPSDLAVNVPAVNVNTTAEQPVNATGLHASVPLQLSEVPEPETTSEPPPSGQSFVNVALLAATEPTRVPAQESVPSPVMVAVDGPVKVPANNALGADCVLVVVPPSGATASTPWPHPLSATTKTTEISFFIPLNYVTAQRAIALNGR